MGVEVHERHRTVPLLGDAKEGQRDRVVAPKGNQALRPLEHRPRGGLDLADRFGNVEGVGADVTGIDHLLGEPRGDRELRVVRAQQLGAGPDAGGTESCTRPVRGSRVEGHTEQGDVGRAWDVVEARQAGEGVRTAEARVHPRVGRPDRCVLG